MSAEGARLAHKQLDLTRSFVHGDDATRDFVSAFLTARHNEIGAGGCDDLELVSLLDDIWFAIDMYDEYDHLREPDQFDDAQLREVLTGYLAGWDAGTWAPDPRWAR